MWAEKGSYRLPQMLETISRLPDRCNPYTGTRFTGEGFAIYVLDNYSIHIMPEVKNALLRRGYFPVFLGGGITGHIQVSMITVVVYKVAHLIKVDYFSNQLRVGKFYSSLGAP